MSKVSFSSGGTLVPMSAEFDRLSAPPIKTIARLEQELADTFVDTTAAVHVLTGSLLASGATQSDFDSHRWEASISYGGPSGGAVNDPVLYAGFEQARGGEHDFLYPTVYHEQAFENIIDDHFSGGI